MKLLILGQGGREHAMAWKLSLSDKVSEVYVCPGNAGTALEERVYNIDININEYEKIISFVKEKNIDLTIVGPEDPLCNGIADLFIKNKLKIFGPTKNLAQLEGSKVFSKNFMQENNIPSAEYKEFDDQDTAVRYIENAKFPLVVKADGLAAGKGVIICSDRSEAQNAIKKLLMSENSKKVVIENFLIGQELSAIYVCNFRGSGHEISLPWTKDYKSRDEYNEGPNTGGMGAVIHPMLDEHKNHIYKMHLEIEEILLKTVKGINYKYKNSDTHYTGFLYIGLMIDQNNKINVLEYNCRMGDPETQCLMMHLQNKNIDFLDLIDSDKLLEKKDMNLDYIDKAKSYACTIVLAAQGYPGEYKKNLFIDLTKIIENEHLKIFHAGTTLEDGLIKSTGGRILSVNASGDSRDKCLKIAYDAIKNIGVYKDKNLSIKCQDHVFFREDIGE